MQSKCSPVCIVYIVDGDAALLGSLERTFRAAGLTAVSYQTAFAFLDAAPDLSDGWLLLDIIMPEMADWSCKSGSTPLASTCR
jgi:two-component system, LuxR family, response regulator FixJ